MKDFSTGIMCAILEFDRTSAFALGEAHPAFTDVARCALQRNADEICRDWSGNGSLLWRTISISNRGRIVTNYQFTQLTEDDVRVRSRAAVVFHVSIVCQIRRRISVYDCPNNDIPTSAQLVRFSGEVDRRYREGSFRPHLLCSIPEGLFARLVRPDSLYNHLVAELGPDFLPFNPGHRQPSLLPLVVRLGCNTGETQQCEGSPVYGVVAAGTVGPQGGTPPADEQPSAGNSNNNADDVD